MKESGDFFGSYFFVISLRPDTFFDYMVFGKVSVSFAREVKVGLNFIAEKLATELRLGVLFFYFSFGINLLLFAPLTHPH
jgi:hypothetical protein